ncbi:DNA repair protein RecN [Prevotella sp. tf2-5]|uniref:DNA repair protein RecN n=1 Tax=Prevotella sp. tf2-5 TaxID=1761889 RepID=UPI0008E5E874|nr:DNA repair protein RecN [Prevotella sp. tf2-5]SFO73611.1 DNA repair protein RecN (Recombination protein N) [Prevotella sp. tf2-5]
MLQQLYIKNFTLIDELNIELHPGFSVITGETGAGKSIILGAIGLLLGQRADSKTIKQGADRCVIEAHFNLSRYQLEPFFTDNDIDYDASDCIIRRELTAAGKSRAFINDTPVSLALLKELGDMLVDVHSQHQNLLLGKQDFQLEVVDTLAKDQDALTAYQQTYAAYHDKQRQLRELQEEMERNRHNLDFLQFQYEELANAQLVEDEQEEMEQQRETMTHSEDIKTALYETQQHLSADEQGVLSLLRKSLSAIKTITKVYPASEEWTERMESCQIELKDIVQDVEARLDAIDFDPAELERINQRLDKLYDLQKKYHVDTVAALIQQRDELKRQLSQIENSDETLSTLQEELDKLRKNCLRQAEELTKYRQKTAKEIERQMHERLVPLGMPNVRFEVKVNKTDLHKNGQDDIAFLFSANTSSPLQPIAQVASGGEIARVMLSLKAMISGAVKLPTIIFDEIDTGVSGKIAERMAEIMQEMGANDRQVISITHLPQIAALGTTHYRVSKEETAKGTVSQMRLLSDEERIHEIAQMLSGSDITAAAIQNAKELLRTKN